MYRLWNISVKISWLETEIPKNVQEGTNTMSVFRMCIGSPGTELSCAGGGGEIQLGFTGVKQISIFLAYSCVHHKHLALLKY